MSDQADIAATLADAGQPMTLTYRGSASYDTTTGAVTAATTTVPTSGVLLPLSRGLMHTPGTNISIGDQRLLLPGSIAGPAIDTTVTIGGRDFVIVEVTHLSPSGTELLYDCIIRGVQ